MLQCPGENDGEMACARNCANEHLSMLRAFTVTGAIEPPSPPPMAPNSPLPGPPPLPPYAPFSECQNTCTGLTAGDTKCRDGGKGSWLPTMCPYATQCDACGFRENTREIEQDDTCATANNGICEDGGYGSETFFDDPLYLDVGRPGALGASATAAAYGPRGAASAPGRSRLNETRGAAAAAPRRPVSPPPFEFEGTRTCRPTSADIARPMRGSRLRRHRRAPPCAKRASGECGVRSRRRAAVLRWRL